MPYETYTPRKFSSGNTEVIDDANKIIEEYRNQGFILTLRQLYYQFVARGLIPNLQSEYKRLGSVINDGRLAGLIDWESIEDRTRHVRETAHWSSPSDIIGSCANQFSIDKWASQPCRVEVWIEKDALLGVIEPACVDLDVPYFACRGYSSQSELWRAGKRFIGHLDNAQDVIVLHFGDHDPSGMDMTRDNRDRLSMFTGENVEVMRLALNMDQVEEFNPPPNPAKITDTRANAYIMEFGSDSWELDALEPAVIDGLIRKAVIELRDDECWEEAMHEEQRGRALLGKCAAQWSDIAADLGDAP